MFYEIAFIILAVLGVIAAVIIALTMWIQSKPQRVANHHSEEILNMHPTKEEIKQILEEEGIWEKSVGAEKKAIDIYRKRILVETVRKEMYGKR